MERASGSEQCWTEYSRPKFYGGRRVIRSPDADTRAKQTKTGHDDDKRTPSFATSIVPTPQNISNNGKMSLGAIRQDAFAATPTLEDVWTKEAVRHNEGDSRDPKFRVKSRRVSVCHATPPDAEETTSSVETPIVCAFMRGLSWCLTALVLCVTVCLKRQRNNEHSAAIRSEYLADKTQWMSGCLSLVIIICLTCSAISLPSAFSLSHVLFHRNACRHRRRWLINPFRKTRI
jgi:hypothetical protein